MSAMSAEDLRMEPVGRSGRDKTIRFLIGGAGEDPDTRLRAAGLKEMLRPRRGRGVMLWRARRGWRHVAAAMVLEHPGRFGAIMHTPATAAGVEIPALRALVCRIAREALSGGLAFLQTLISPALQEEIALVRSAGFAVLAELSYLSIDLADPTGCDPCSSADRFQWLRFGQFDEEALGRIIAKTYEGSLDCPGLSGIRDMPDVIAGHKGGQRFCPECWWIVCDGNQAVGCILVNDAPSGAAAEVIYMGVSPAWRGQGLGRTMLQRTAAAAQRRGRSRMTLAVDRRNHWARQLYTDMGFDEVHRRMACIFTPREAAKRAVR